MDGVFLDWALEAFSGSVAVDELYEGPYFVLSAVDNRQFKRLRMRCSITIRVMRISSPSFGV